MIKKKSTKNSGVKTYKHPITSRDDIFQHLELLKVPAKFSVLAKGLKHTDDYEREALKRRLTAMVRDGQLYQNRHKEYCLPDKLELLKGTIIGHPDGFGFLQPEAGGDDVFIPFKQMKMALHGDVVLIKVLDIKGRRKEGRIVTVISRVNVEVVGQYFVEGDIGFLQPHNRKIHQDIVIPHDKNGGAKPGQIVVAEITAQPSLRNQPVGKIKDILGDHLAPGMEIKLASTTYGLPIDWNEDIESELTDMESLSKDLSGRIDIRDLPLVTIDGKDAKDFDDAVYCKNSGQGWRLVVAIADVSHYVAIGSALDNEAFIRGNSVYFPDEVIPMLPEGLSNELCSLKPNVDRLCMVCDLDIDSIGKVIGTKFYSAVMKSHARLTYHQVADFFSTGQADFAENLGHSGVESLNTMRELYKVLNRLRLKRGALNFDRAETKIVVNDERKIEDILPAIRNDAHKMIEEFMILANIESALFLAKNDFDVLFRVHAAPSVDRLKDLRLFLSGLGLRLDGGDQPESKDYARLIEAVQHRKDKNIVELVLLRSLSKAEYYPENIGHFGLALNAYAHFTSPIRRYPDLIIHRCIKRVLNNTEIPERPYSVKELLEISQQCSLTERRADDASRDVLDWMKCEYMLDRVGQEYSAVITSVLNFGFFVELKSVYVEGLVHITNLPTDYYQFDPIKHSLVGNNTGIIFRLMDEVRVKLVQVNLDDRKIDFSLCNFDKTGDRKPNKKKSGKKSNKKSRKSKSKKRALVKSKSSKRKKRAV